MKESKGFLVAVALGAAAFLVFRYFLVSPVTARTDEARGKLNNHLAKRSGYFRKKGKPIRAVKKELEAEGSTLKELASSVGPVGLALPPELEPTDDHLKLSYYQMRRSKLNERANGSGITFSNEKSPLGLPLVVPEENVPEFLARLAVAGRFLDAASAAHLPQVVRAEHPPARMGPPSAGRVCEELPFKIVVAADEKSLILMLWKLSRPEKFLALRELELEVKNAASGTFEARLELAGVRVVAAPKEAEAAERGPAVPGPPRRPPSGGFRRRY